MKPFVLCLVAWVALAKAEAPLGGGSGYSYSAPSHGGGGFSSFSGGSSFSSAGSFGGGGLQEVPVGGQTSEGQRVDGAILEKVRQIILRDEASSSSSSGGGGGGISGSYGAPRPVYGPPSHQTRVIGVDLEGVRQAIQVAQYLQHAQEQISIGGGYGRGPSTSYGTPSSSYGSPF